MSESVGAGWRSVTLSDLGEVNRGRSRHRPRYAEHLYGGAYPFIQTGDVKASGGRITSYSQTYSEEGLSQSRLWPAGTMCITIAANIAETGILEFDSCFPDSVVGFIADDSKANVHFVQYAFRTVKARLQHEASGSVQDNINLETLSRTHFAIPPLREQEAIVEVLGALDDKIAANQKLAHVAFETSAALYESTYADTSAAVPLRTIATTVLGGTPSKSIEEYWKDGTVPWLNSGKANEDRILVPSAMITEEALSQSAAKLMPVGTTVIAITGATLGKVSRLEISAAGNQSLVGIWSDDTAHNNWLHFAIRKEIPQLLKKATGAAQQHVNKRDVDSLLIYLPSPDTLEKSGYEISNLLNIASSADRENLSLSNIRNMLLPQLMSGKLKVKEAEEIVTSAV